MPEGEGNLDKKYEKVKNILYALQRDVANALDTVKRLEEQDKKDKYKNVPGIEGTFDGLHLVSDDGKKHEVPANYAAKSRLVFGDKLKMIAEDGKTLFKQVQKADRQSVEGILSKKEGKWYLLCEAGTFKISDTAAEFNHVEMNDKAIGIIPKGKTPATYAALDRVLKPAVVPEPKPASVPVVVVKPQPAKPLKKEEKPKKAVVTTNPRKKVEVRAPIKKEFVADITAQTQAKQVLADDDLR